ncbi:hypothetical protein JL720_11864 [Aureococcus anophagefferens]|nr:hypothetical protein JL720_11864 [Aureococcus anophagefferens]
MTRRVARAALAYAAVGARARVCEVTIQVDGAGVGLAFADDAELDAAVRGFVARFALPLDQMGCADDDCAVEYIKAHARLNAACDAAPYGGARRPRGRRVSDDAAPLDDDDTARSEPDATADAGEREAAGEAAPAGSAALLPSTLEDYVTLWMVAWSACFAVAAAVAALDRALDLRAALGAAQLVSASRDTPASPLRETLLWALLHSSERACFESHGLGKQGAYAALVQLWVALTPGDPGRRGAVGVLFQIWATHAFAGAEKAGLGRDAWRRVCDSLLAAPPRDAAVAAATADGYDAEVQPDGEIRATFHFTWRGAQRSFAVAVPGGGALWSARDASRDVGAACDDAGVPAADCDATLKPHVLAALRDLARPASVSRVDLCKPDDTVGDVEAFVAASVSVAKITTLDCATDEVRNEDVDLPARCQDIRLW